MSTFAKTVSRIREISARHKAEAEEYYTHVEGVGPVPRDIYKYVKSDPLGDLPRYSPHIVIQHLLVFITFILLAATGLPIYYSDQFWASYFVSLLGGIDTARIIHRVMAFIMIFAAAYHLITIIGGTARKISRHEFDYRRTQLPRLKDLFDLIQDIKYFLGLAPYRPKMEKFMYKQKAHYLAIIWGNFVLIAAGSALLFPSIMAKIFPETLGKILPLGGVGADSYSAFLQDLARLMHADEAVMALILLAFWHWTNVHLVPGRFPIQWAFLTGKITREHQIEEHFLEYLHNLREIPEEREYMKNLLKERGIEGSRAVSVADKDTSFSQPVHPAPGEKT